MMVYIVTRTGCDGIMYIDEVFESKDKAEKYIEEWEKNTRGQGCDYEIKSWEVVK